MNVSFLNTWARCGLLLALIAGCGTADDDSGGDIAGGDAQPSPTADADIYSDGSIVNDGELLPPNDMDTPRPSTWTTERVYGALRPSCVACHTIGQTFPYFENLGAFQEELLIPGDWVVAGEPENSPLLELLDGSHDGRFRKCHPVAPYSEITANDPSTPTIEELADWIRTLDPNMEISEIPCADVPAPKVMHRLNRVEYNRAVQHLTGTMTRPADDFPRKTEHTGWTILPKRSP